MRFDFRFIDFIDIVLVAILLYKTYKMLHGTTAIKVFIGILVFIIGWLTVSFLFQMQLMGGLMNQIVNVGVVAIIVLFQDEIRRFLSMLGSKNNFLLRFVGRVASSNPSNNMKNAVVMQIVMACRNMSKAKIGALIVIPNNDKLKDIEITGESIDGNVSTRLIENIFFKNSPLHDGAMIISGNKIVSAGCILPVSHNQNIPKSAGLRHRAALGVTERTDALVVVVSEETGRISYAMQGELKMNITAEQLEALLSAGADNENKQSDDKSGRHN